ncbi:MAG: hypothetical protein ACAH59_03705 [Pseudobdellovibrionaceae bacterium]
MSQYDLGSLYDFLLHTPEQGLRKMLVDGKPMTEVHLNLLLKVVRGCKYEEFTGYFEKGEFPKLKFGPAENKIKEKFWKDCIQSFNSRGLLNPAPVQKQEKIAA